jgi:hypothetical protein
MYGDTDAAILAPILVYGDSVACTAQTRCGSVGLLHFSFGIVEEFAFRPAAAEQQVWVTTFLNDGQAAEAQLKTCWNGGFTSQRK